MYQILIAAALLAGLGFGAVAQPQPMQPGQPPAMARGEHRGDRARFMQERMAHRAAELKASGAIQGKGDLVDVVTAVQAAEVSLETVVAIRDKVIAAYQEIMRMPI